LMYVPEEDTYWMLVKIFEDKKYSLRGRYLDGFPLLQQSFWIFDQLLMKACPKLFAHLKNENVMTISFATRWFLMVYLDSFPFPITIRIWDLFLMKGYDILYTIAIGLMKMFERKLLGMPFDQIMTFWKELETLEDDPDDFIPAILKYKVKSDKIRKLESQYDADSGYSDLRPNNKSNGHTTNTTNNSTKKKTN